MLFLGTLTAFSQTFVLRKISRKYLHWPYFDAFFVTFPSENTSLSLKNMLLSRGKGQESREKRGVLFFLVFVK